MDKLQKLHPTVRKLAVEFLKECKKQGLDVMITQTSRTFNEQNELYAKGRTKPGRKVTNARGGQSIHNYGLAFDIAIKKNGEITWDDEGLYKKAGLIGEKVGLEWGGNWKQFKDLPHFQWTGGLTLRDLQRGKRPKENNKNEFIKLRYTIPMMRGNDIKKMQEILIKLGFLKDKADGIFGKNTQLAVLEYQKLHIFLPQDGGADKATWDSIMLHK